jgi:hypothetical protein
MVKEISRIRDRNADYCYMAFVLKKTMGGGGEEVGTYIFRMVASYYYDTILSCKAKAKQAKRQKEEELKGNLISRDSGCLHQGLTYH